MNIIIIYLIVSQVTSFSQKILKANVQIDISFHIARNLCQEINANYLFFC